MCVSVCVRVCACVCVCVCVRDQALSPPWASEQWMAGDG